MEKGPYGAKNETEKSARVPLLKIQNACVNQLAVP